MFKHKVDFTEHMINPVFLRAIALHFSSREYKVENKYVYFNYDVRKDEIFLADWNVLQLVEVHI